MSKETLLMVVLFVFVLAHTTIAVMAIQHYAQPQNDPREMVFFKNHTRILAGYFEPNQNYYCVWTTNKTRQQIMDTDYHEACHYLINIDYEHFCE